LQKVELFGGAVIGAVERGFVADQDIQRPAFPGELLKDKGEAGFLADVVEGVVDVGLRDGQFVVEQIGFKIADASQAPAGDGHGMDQLYFDGVGGVVAVDVGVEEKLEVVLRFTVEDAELGGESVAKSVL
jgi:hypothetical protein